MTAVGDDKQTIMGFAGAKPAIFEEYLQEAGAITFRLRMNWRSAPGLIRFQNFLVEQLLNKPAVAEPSANWNGSDGEVRMCFFPEPGTECNYLVEQITKWINEDGLSPREICVLVKVQPGNYTPELTRRLGVQGIRARDESRLQDLLTEPVPVFMVHLLEVLFSGQYSRSWDHVFDFLFLINQSYEDHQVLSLRRRSIKVIKGLRAQFITGVDRITDIALNALLIAIAQFVDVKKIKDYFPQYKEGTWLKEMIEQMRDYLLVQYNQTGDFMAAIQALKGEDTIPIMTTHKSKGLEFHTVIFLGLEDSAFWKYHEQPTSDNNLFFVALSRAKERVLFTFCHHRTLPRRGGPQTAEAISVIHQLFQENNEVVLVDLTKPRGNAIE